MRPLLLLLLPLTTALRLSAPPVLTTTTVLPPPDPEVSILPIVVCSPGTPTIGFCTLSVSCGIPYGGCTSHCAGAPAPTFVPPVAVEQACVTWTEPELAPTMTEVVYVPHTTYPVGGSTWWVGNGTTTGGEGGTRTNTLTVPGVTTMDKGEPTETPEGEGKGGEGEEKPAEVPEESPQADKDNAGGKVSFGLMGALVPALVVAGAVGFMW